MLKKLVEFFSNLFSGIFGGKKKKPVTTPVPQKTETERETPATSTPSTTTTTTTPSPNTNVVTEDAQDASELQPDSTIVAVKDTGEEIIVTIDPPEIPTETPVDFSESGEVNPDDDETKIVVTPPVVDTPVIPIKTTPTENKLAHKARYLWCLDNGHGKKTAGKRSPRLSDGDRFHEYEFNRDIVRRIISSLKEIGVEYYNVVPEIDIDNFLEGRVGRANKKKSKLPKLLLSVHSNAAPAPTGKWSNPKISGIETWYFHSSRRGRKMASIFQKHLTQATGWKDRFIKSQPGRQFYVLKNTSMTAVLTENGFYNNKAQCLELMKNTVRQKIADAHVRAILEIEEKGI